MDSLIKDKRTRLKITLAAAVFLVVTTYVSIFKEMEAVATTCIAGVMTVLSTYIWAETKRPSNPRE
jgi:O-antigen/teichoic acid export membrane protein